MTGKVIHGVFRENCFSAEKARSENLLGRKIKDARKERGMLQSDVIDALKEFDIAIGTAALSRWEKGSNMPSPLQFLALCRIYGIQDPLGYLTGCYASDAYLAELNEAGRKKVMDYAEDLRKSGLYSVERHIRPVEKDLPRPTAMRRMPVSMLKVSAGTGVYLDEEDFEEEEFPEEDIPTQATFGLYVSGDSMSPLYQDGDLVWVQRCGQLRKGEIGIFLLDGEGYIKKYEEKRIQGEWDEGNRVVPVLVSLNPRYEPITVTEDRELRIVGRVLPSERSC